MRECKVSWTNKCQVSGEQKKKHAKKDFFFKNHKYFENKVKLLWWNKTFAIDYKSPEMFVSWAN